jgi:hypothetical protein
MAGRHPLAEDNDDTDDFYAQLSAAAEQAAEPLAPDGSLRSLRQLYAQVWPPLLAHNRDCRLGTLWWLKLDRRMQRIMTLRTSWWLVMLL